MIWKLSPNRAAAIFNVLEPKCGVEFEDLMPVQGFRGLRITNRFFTRAEAPETESAEMLHRNHVVMESFGE